MSLGQNLPQEFLSQVASHFPSDFLTQNPSELEVFGKDWTRVFAPCPSAVVFPRTTQEVVQFVQLCSQFKIAIVPSGGRTGLSGGAVACHGEVVLSLSRMIQMGPVDPLALTVRVQAGVVTEAVHQYCEPYGLTWPVDFASKGSSEVGGNISTNAGGVKVIHYGLTRNWVLGLQVVTMNGEVLELNGELEKNNTGIDLRQLFIGSEGILGIITDATLKLCRVPKSLDVFLFAVDGISSVLKLFQKVRQAPFSVTAFEFFMDNCLRLVIETRKIQSPFKEHSPSYVLLEIERPQSSDSQAVLDQWLEGLFKDALILDGTLAQSPREAKDLWTLRESISESLAIKGFVHKNDIALPISKLEKFIEKMFHLLGQRNANFEIFLFGHIGDGNLHVNTMKPKEMSKEEFVPLCREMDTHLFDLVRQFNGSISAEHGIGLLKKASLKYSRSPEEIRLMHCLKKVFDPDCLLNPGKVIDLI